jgi:glycosyltransferase involved in cell wall biosynthesis
MTSARRFRVLYVAYPLLPVSEHSAGGAEQVLWTLERTMHARGHETCVAAAAGSQVAGEHFSTGAPAELPDRLEERLREQTTTLLKWLREGAQERFDLVHDMSGAFWQHAAEVGLPVLATLHLPRRLYSEQQFRDLPPHVFFSCVSESQRREFSELPRMLEPVQNGIALDRFTASDQPPAEREYLLWLGRICEEKGTHTALDVAHAAGEKLIVAGAVYPFLYHQKYFAREVIPRLKRAGRKAKYIPSPSFAEKLDLLRQARALLITSDIPETSSIVAMEAAACGTPVMALRRGALEEVVAPGGTGILISTPEEMSSAISGALQLRPADCRSYAHAHYSATRMAERYEATYDMVLTTVHAAFERGARAETTP